MNTTQPGSLHHIELYVSDLPRSRKFWEWFLVRLGYSLYQEWEQGFSFKLGDTYLVFVQTREGFNATEYHRCRTGLNHFAFRAASRDQVDAITTELRSRGIQILYEDRHPHAGGPETYALYFEDPDRIKVELVAPD